MKTTSICSLTMATPSDATYMWVSKRAMRQSRAEAGSTSAKQNSSARRKLRQPTLSANAADKGGAPGVPVSLLSVLKQKLFIEGTAVIVRSAKSEGRKAKSEKRFSELHRDRFALRRLGDVEELLLLDVEHTSHHVRRERLDLCVQVAHHRVVITASILDRIFQSAQRTLQRLELLRGAQLRVSLGHRKQPAQGVGELSLGFALLRRSGGGHGRTAIFGDVLEGPLFVRGVALHGFHQVGDKVVAAFQLHVDIGPGVVGADLQLHQTVVNADQRERDDGQYGDNNDDSNHAVFLQQGESSTAGDERTLSQGARRRQFAGRRRNRGAVARSSLVERPFKARGKKVFLAVVTPSKSDDNRVIQNPKGLLRPVRPGSP